VGEALKSLVDDNPAVREQVFNADGTLHRYLNVYVNDDDVRYTGGLETPVAETDEITLLPAVAGG
jgi:molybdopterin converting factor small subunit